jgi:hypothetical protein
MVWKVHNVHQFTSLTSTAPELCSDAPNWTNKNYLFRGCLNWKHSLVWMSWEDCKLLLLDFITFFKAASKSSLTAQITTQTTSKSSQNMSLVTQVGWVSKVLISRCHRKTQFTRWKFTFPQLQLSCWNVGGYLVNTKTSLSPLFPTENVLWKMRNQPVNCLMFCFVVLFFIFSVIVIIIAWI